MAEQEKGKGQFQTFDDKKMGKSSAPSKGGAMARRLSSKSEAC